MTVYQNRTLSLGKQLASKVRTNMNQKRTKVGVNCGFNPGAAG